MRAGGHSLGGAAALLAAHRLKTLRSLVVIGSPAEPDHIRHLLSNPLEVLHREGVAEVMIAGRSFPIARGFLDDLARHDQDGRVAGLGRPRCSFFTRPMARPSTSRRASRIFEQARQRKAFVPPLGSDHLLSGRRLSVPWAWWRVGSAGRCE